MHDALLAITAIPFLLSMVLLGLPHGAVDHFVYFRSKGLRMTTLRLTAFVVVYIAIAALFFGFWLAAPLICAIAFLFLTGFHWGEGDLAYERKKGNAASWRFGLFRGLLPMALPLVLHPEPYRIVLGSAVTAIKANNAINPFEWIAHPAVRGGIVLIVAGAYLLASRRDGHMSDKRIRWENILLVAWFILLPPLLSVGIYFIFWHAYRHVRTITDIIGRPLRGESGQIRWGHFYLMAAPFTLPAIVAIGVVAELPQDAGNWLVWLGSYLVFLWALTWPHMWICHECLPKREIHASDNSQRCVVHM